MKKIILALFLFVAYLSFTATFCQATVSNGTNQVIYNGDGVTSTFSFSFNVYNSASENDLLVSELNTTTGSVTNLTLNTDYTVSLTHATPSPGTITLTAGALATGINLSILRNLPLTQLVSEADNSATPASVRNNVYDRQVMVSQQLQQQLTRAVLQNIFATTSVTLPAGVANYGLCWDSTGTTITNCASLTGSIGVPIANGNLQTLTAANLVNGSSLFGTGTMTGLSLATLGTTGNVGIGTPSPSGARLVVSGGNVGIGSVSPGAQLDVPGTVRAGNFFALGTSFGFWGTPVSCVATTTYTAAHDGIVFVAAEATNTSNSVALYVNASNPASGGARVSNFGTAAANSSGEVAWFVSQGQNYEAVLTNMTIDTCQFVPVNHS